MIRLACISLILCMLFHTCGPFFVLYYRQMVSRSEMRQYLRQHVQHADIKRFQFSDGDQTKIAWEDENEFSLDGEMYDVIKKVKQGKTLVVYCVADKKETRLIQQFLTQAKKQIPVKENDSLRTQLLMLLYWVDSGNQAVPLASTRLLHFDLYTFSLPYIHQNIPAPPPRIVA